MGTYDSFRRAMLQGISRHPDLVRWTARNDEDYGIALLSMWAYIADILTFYGERAVHEAFLGTAIHGRSLRRLAAMLDYLPAPGSAATAYLAYVAEIGKRFEVRPGMRVQSVPGQDEKPQKFEPVETVTVEPALNEVQVLPEPQGTGMLASGALSAALTAELAEADPELAPGDRLLAVSGGVVEEKLLTAVGASGWRTILHWRPALREAGVTFYKWRRKIRLFGHNAPAPWLQPQIVAGEVTGFGEVNPGDTDYEVVLDDTDELDLDGTYDLGIGARVLVTGTDESDNAFAEVREIERAGADAVQVGPLSGSTTRLTLDATLGVDTDLRTVTVYELVEVAPGQVEIELWPYEYGDEIPANSSSVWVRGDADEADTLLPEIEEDRRLTLVDGKGNAHSATAQGPPIAEDYGGVSHLRITFDPVLDAPIDTVTAVLRVNVAEASHGETVTCEVLGSGDAAKTFQRFVLAKPFVTHVPDATAEHGARSTLEVRVDGVRWERVRSFCGISADQRVYVERVDEEGTTSVSFGDGRTGAKVHSGKNNVTATYRHGQGLDGRVDAGALRIALDRPRGLRSVTNPVATFGGSDPETAERVRDNATNGVRTFGRIVSLADFEDAAREYSGVAKARAVERWEGEERRVCLFVAGDDGAILGTDGLADLRAYLDARRDPRRWLTVRDLRPVYVALDLNVQVHPDHLEETVLDAVAEALIAHFDFDARDLGEAVRISDLYRVAQEVTGVVGVDFDRLVFKDPGSLDLTGRAMRYDGSEIADLQPRLLLYAGELAAVEEASDVVIEAGISGARSAT